ncbi:hypothetical protein MNBD_GAMMA21-847 [hydrothermal vent metagenome]|uniref:YHS domain-containing protein n=1 Tax=hydrothermal vent metagenome TaxID=652676 RepID=A0A3B1ASX5_9ZZZZ
MIRNKNIHNCPVCNMVTNLDCLSSEYRSEKFFFCSEQCLERFTANPGVYIGGRGIPSAKQRGERCIKRRTLKLDSVVPVEMAENIINDLQAMMGVIEVDVDADKINIIYDLIEVTTKQIETVLEKTGNNASKKYGEVLKRAFIHYNEETIMDNLEHNADLHSHH